MFVSDSCSQRRQLRRFAVKFVDACTKQTAKSMVVVNYYETLLAHHEPCVLAGLFGFECRTMPVFLDDFNTCSVL